MVGSKWFITRITLFIILCAGAIASVKAGTLQGYMATGRDSQNTRIVLNISSDLVAREDNQVRKQRSNAGGDPTRLDETEEEEDSAMPVVQGKRPPGTLEPKRPPGTLEPRTNDRG
jgi:hypothetical protein